MKAVTDTIHALGSPVFVQELGDTGTPNAAIARWRHKGADIDIDGSDTVRCTISLQDGQDVRHETAHAAAQAHIHVGSVSIMPADHRARLAIRGDADVVQIFLRETLLDDIVEGRFACRALFNSHDNELQAAAFQIVVAARRGEPDDALLLDLGVRRLVDRLLDLSARQMPTTVYGGLAPAAHRRVDDLIAAAIADFRAPSPTLRQMADAVNLSVNHFIRAFRQQTGVTPHRHVVLRRLERAIALLKTPATSVAEVADETGFATPAHFVATFRRTMGVTPRAFRTALLI